MCGYNQGLRTSCLSSFAYTRCRDHGPRTPVMGDCSWRQKEKVVVMRQCNIDHPPAMNIVGSAFRSASNWFVTPSHQPNESFIVLGAVELTSRPSLPNNGLVSLWCEEVQVGLAVAFFYPKSSKHVAKTLIDKRTMHTREEVRNARDPTVE